MILYFASRMKKHSYYSKIPLSQTIVSLCEAKGIHHIVISPGSRNAPLTIGFTGNPRMNCYSIVDERCAAFFALGLAQQTGKPAALVCTSGSALLNYYPAVAEAYYSDIPLVVISADRPIERIDIGDGQTIRQKNIFENHILYSASLYSEVVATQEVVDIHVKQRHHEVYKHNAREVNLALNKAIEQKGPVHINAPFYEPLYDKLENQTVFPKNIPLEDSRYHFSESLKKEMLERWNTTDKKIVLIGVNSLNTLDQKWVDVLANDPSVLVLTETTSNIYHDSHINCIDQLITPLSDKEFLALQPAVLLTIGGMVISKRIKAFLRKYQPQSHWHIDEKKAFDTYFCLTEHIKLNPNLFFETLADELVSVASTYKKDWLAVRKERRHKHAAYLKQVAYSDLKAFERIFEQMPEGQYIQLSNSSTVRYAQLFSLSPSFRLFCNRGTSGIDGSTSTAIGAAIGSQKPTTLITGDLSFFYDSNALWNAYIPANFKIIVINNSGGGIFRILPGKEESEAFSTFFETKHSLTAEQLCAMYGIVYHKASSEEAIVSGMESLYALDDVPALLEIFTPRIENDKVLIGYFRSFV
ncbi:2-succinyl-5-enolpyruvyl-6-hydroxy-3-cyclohexene-1-carboxylic-acid synthase [Aquimarina hainanensis]